MSIPVWNRPANKENGATFALTEAQLATRERVCAQIHGILEENLEALGGFITPGNNPDKASLMVALTLPMPPLHFTPEGAEEPEETRAYTLNINAVIPAPKKSGETATTGEPVLALSYAELRKNQLALRAARK